MALNWIKEAKAAAANVIPQISQTFQKPADQMSPTHKAVQELYNSVERVFDAKKAGLPSEVRIAAENFLSDLESALEEDPIHEHSKAALLQLALAERTFEIIYKYQPQLEATPGLWNQLRAQINTFIERVTGIKDIIGAPRKTFFGENKEIQTHKNTVGQARDEMWEEVKHGPKDPSM